MIKLRLQQGSNTNDPMVATLLSLGASGLDDQADFGVADLITMDPPYAFIGSSDCVGIGFRTAMLDLSDGSTPPDVLAQFGFDDSWTGIYLPELRIYIAPEGAQDLAFDASATNLVIGIGASAGITGDFEFTIVDQGSGPVTVSARFYDATGNCYGITQQADGNSATVTIPDHTRMVVDIDGGLTPYTSSAKIGNAADTPGRLFNVDFGSDSSLTIVITAKGSQPNATATTLTITAALKTQSASPPAGTAQAPTIPTWRLQTTSVTRGGAAVYVTAAQDRVADVEHCDGRARCQSADPGGLEHQWHGYRHKPDGHLQLRTRRHRSGPGGRGRHAGGQRIVYGVLPLRSSEHPD